MKVDFDKIRPMKAGDESVLVNGRVLPVPFRIIWEDYYKELKIGYEKVLQQDKEVTILKCLSANDEQHHITVGREYEVLLKCDKSDSVIFKDNYGHLRKDSMSHSWWEVKTITK